MAQPHNEQAVQSSDSAATFLATLPRPSSEEVQALLRAQGAKQVERFEDLLGDWSEDDEDVEFDVDEFLQERRKWQWEGAPTFPDAQDRSSSAGQQP
jgi:hypothetical protein